MFIVIVVDVITAFIQSYLLEFHCILGQWEQNCSIMRKNWRVKVFKLYMD